MPIWNLFPGHDAGCLCRLALSFGLPTTTGQCSTSILTSPPPACPLHAGFIHSRPEALYFWFYFVFVNAIWIVVPFCCVAHAWGKISKAVAAAGGGGRKGKKA